MAITREQFNAKELYFGTILQTSKGMWDTVLFDEDGKNVGRLSFTTKQGLKNKLIELGAKAK